MSGINKTWEINFSKIDWWSIEKKELPNLKEKLAKLTTNLETRWEQSELAKNIFWTDLEKTNFLARIDEVSKMCNKNKEQFLNICSQNLDLKLS